MTPAARQIDRTTAGALALQRVLALEGRNALSRVELAASELSRFGLVPGALERVTAIREAVGELDALLDKIERLAEPACEPHGGAGTSIEAAWEAVRARIEPVLAARDLRLERAPSSDGPPVALPGPVTERLLLLWIRTVVAAIERERIGEAETAPITLRLSSRGAAAGEADPAEEQGGGAGGIELALCALRHEQGLRLPLERAERVELEVALAEWHAWLAVTEDAAGTCLHIGLPGALRDAG
jgi:hypothetical protein